MSPYLGRADAPSLVFKVVFPMLQLKFGYVMML